jgi:DNA-binding beta-propeller fold protein YncE
VISALHRHRAAFAAGALTAALATALPACTSSAGDQEKQADSDPTAVHVPPPTPPATRVPLSPHQPLGAFRLSPAAGPGHLAPGSDPHALPGPVLIADEDNNRLLLVDQQGRIRWRFPSGSGLPHGQVFGPPDDSFVSPDGRAIIATQEMYDTVSVIDIATGRITRHYGHAGTPGAAPGYFSHPDDAMLLPGGDLLVPDIINCRILVLAPGRLHVVRRFGGTAGCAHDPPAAFGSPNGAFPLADGNFLVTEINGDWVDEMSLRGRVYWSTHPPGVAYPSDTNQADRGSYVTADYSYPGQIVIFSRSGRTIWRFRPTGAQTLNHPSLALPLPNGNILVNDDYNDRVIVIDRGKNRVVWQYGHYGVPGSAPGYLDNPDGVDLAPPYSLLVTRAPTLGRP